MKLTFLSILVVALFMIQKCLVRSHSYEEAHTTTFPDQSQKQNISDFIQSHSYNHDEAGKTSLKNTRNTHNDAPGVYNHGHTHFSRKHGKNQHISRPEGLSKSAFDGQGSFKSSINQDRNEVETGIQGRGIIETLRKVTVKEDAKGRGLGGLKKLVPPLKKAKKGSNSPSGPVSTSTTTPEPPSTLRAEYVEPDPLPEDADCKDVTRDAAWVDQVRIRPCHYTTHNHPRQQTRRKWSPDTNSADKSDMQSFNHLAIFNIKHDLDFQEAGDDCSVELQEAFMFDGGEEDEEAGGTREPVDIEVMSFNRVWYKRLCSFFSFLECIPKDQVRKKYKYSSDGSKQMGNVDEYILNFNDSGLDTTGLLRLKIGGRGPGKARHKSGPGGGRLDHRAFQGMSDMVNSDKFPLDGICACSQNDPKYPERRRTLYGMDFVEDEARPRWCVAAPGNLCGRVYFKRNIWPGQFTFEFSDHIGCPRKYNGDEYECVRWKKDPNVQTNRTEFPKSMTSTCEKKPKDPEAERQRKISRSNRRKRNSDVSIFKEKTFSLTFLSVVAIYTV